MNEIKIETDEQIILMNITIAHYKLVSSVSYEVTIPKELRISTNFESSSKCIN